MHPLPVVLLLDPCEHSRLVLSRALRINGLDTLCAGSAPDALALALRHQPDLAIVVVSACGFDGIGARRLLAQVPATAALPTLALTTSTSGEHHADIMAAGFHGIAVQPGSPESVVQAAREMLGWLQFAGVACDGSMP